jgi:hypothetical protein
VCKCVLPPGDNPIAVNKYININESRKLVTGGKWSTPGFGTFTTEECVRYRKPLSVHLKVKVKVKFTTEQAMKAQRRSRGITILFL